MTEKSPEAIAERAADLAAEYERTCTGCAQSAVAGLLDAFEIKYPEHLTAVTESRLERMAEVCRQAHGEAFARQCVARARETGHITPIQRYFGLHYRANEMPVGNEAFLAVLQEAGLDWFKEWSPAEGGD